MRGDLKLFVIYIVLASLKIICFGEIDLVFIYKGLKVPLIDIMNS